jgi:hypothetical protein
MNTNGVIFYKGKSEITGESIVGVATGLKIPSRNAKTGDVIQTFILRSDLNPLFAVLQDKDKAICGNCPLKYTNSNLCYVNVSKSVSHVYNCFKRNNYAYTDVLNTVKSIRLGSYGDPTAIPIKIWQKILKNKSFVGYTHNWKFCNPKWRNYLLASIESPKLIAVLNNLGWYTARIIKDKSELTESEILCPAQATNNLIKCENCLLCNPHNKQNVCFLVHGTRKQNFGTVV